MSEKKTYQDVWINQNGLAACQGHGGSYLAGAISRGEGPEILTPLDHWIFYPADVAAEHDVECETCKRERENNA